METDSTSEKPIVITDSEHDRYFTFGLISWWQKEVVQNATVLVIGAGALGNEVLKNLALMGVGRIIIVDFDTVEDANLSRSILFREKDNGRKKAEAAAESVKNINADVKVMWLHADVNWQIGLGIYRRANAILGCLDNREARLSINKACWRVGKPWVDGAIETLSGEARVFWGGHGACYECLLSERDWLLINRHNSCPGLARANILVGKTPTTPTIASIIAGIQTQEVMKLLNGLEVRPGSGIVFNGFDNDSYITAYSVKTECQNGCEYNETMKEIIEWPEGSAATTTVRQLLEFAEQKLGPGAYLELDREFVVAFQGKEEHDRVDVLRPFGELNENDAIDLTTGDMRMPVFTHKVSADEKFADLPLAKLGIPALHIVSVRCGKKYLHIELTGDAEKILRFI